MSEVLTTPGEAETVTTTAPVRTPRPKREPKRPTVEVLQEVIVRHCNNQHVTSVGDLCHQQTETLIDELATLFG